MMTKTRNLKNLKHLSLYMIEDEIIPHQRYIFMGDHYGYAIDKGMELFEKKKEDKVLDNIDHQTKDFEFISKIVRSISEKNLQPTREFS